VNRALGSIGLVLAAVSVAAAWWIGGATLVVVIVAVATFGFWRLRQPQLRRRSL